MARDLDKILFIFYFFIFPIFFASLGHANEAFLGKFRLEWSSLKNGAPWLRVSHLDEPSFIVWESVPGRGFVEAATGKLKIAMNHGSFRMDDQILSRYDHQSVHTVEQKGDRLQWIGNLQKKDWNDSSPLMGYQLTFFPASDCELAFELELLNPNETLSSDDYRTFLNFQTHSEEHFFGFGEQFSYFDLKGKQVPILVQEQGIGRGFEPVTALMNFISPQTGGSWSSSYASVPQYITSDRHSFFLENYEYSIFDLREKYQVSIELFGTRMKGRILFGADLLSLVSTYSQYSGRMRPLPLWTDQGAIVEVQGGELAVYAALEKIEEAQTPISAFWIQDWVGSYSTAIGSFRQWNWLRDRSLYPHWEEMVHKLANKGIRVLAYINPFLDVPSQKNNFHSPFFDEALKKKFLVQKADGSPYLINYLLSSVGLVDLSQPDARMWMKNLIRSQLLDAGVSGWMADFGEAFPMDARLSESSEFRSAFEYHNRFPVDWARIQKEVLEETGRLNDTLVLSRSGFTRSPGQVSLFWLGDQLTSWDAFDGMKTALVGLLSSGLSGFSLNHSDIGGYTTATLPIIDIGYYRTQELFMRWTEMNAFTAMFRTHKGSKPTINHQYDSNAETLSHFTRFAKIFRALAPYRRSLMEEADASGLPLVRPLLLHYPQDPTVYSLTHEFLLGRDFLIAPVLDPGAHSVEMYFPQGEWVGVFSQHSIVSGAQGTWLKVETPLGSPAVFYRKESAQAQKIVTQLAVEGLL